LSRGFKKDGPATADAYKRGLLIDVKRRSFISQAKLIEGENEVPEPHLLLAGADKSKARIALFQRERNRCQKCKCIVVWGSDEFGWSEYGERGEMQHVRDKPWNKCDCPRNLVLSCHRCHQGQGSEHYKRRPRFGEKVAV
jgi:hypothetical protein